LAILSLFKPTVLVRLGPITPEDERRAILHSDIGSLLGRSPVKELTGQSSEELREYSLREILRLLRLYISCSENQCEAGKGFFVWLHVYDECDEMQIEGRQMTATSEDFVQMEDARVVRVGQDRYKAWLRHPVYNPDAGTFSSRHTDLGELRVRPGDSVRKS
jgi:hypothetical protein